MAPSTKKKTSPEFKACLEFALNQDEQDPLKPFCEEFYFPLISEETTKDKKTPIHQKPCLYLAGHSLGLQPKKSKNFLDKEIQIWRDKAVEGHFFSTISKKEKKEPWVSYEQPLEKSLAHLLKAKEKEISLMNSLTVNIHLMMISFYRPTKTRHKILLLKEEFSSDRYALMSQLLFRGYSPASSLVSLSPRSQENYLHEEDLIHAIETQGEEIALIYIGNPNYLTGQAFNIRKITKLGHNKGCMVGFDLAHGVGNLDLNLHEDGPDFALWCSYKYLNGGPGSIGGCFIHERHLKEQGLPRFSGWWGHEEQSRFEMSPHFQPMKSAGAWKLSNPSIFQIAPLFASMKLFEQAGQKNLREKGKRLTSFLEFLLKNELQDSVQILTPSDPKQRGSQLSLVFPKKGEKKDFHFISKIQKKLRKYIYVLPVKVMAM